MLIEAGATRALHGQRRGSAPIRAFLRILRRPVWLPRPVYSAVPWFYLGSGGASLLGGLFLTDRTWFVPYLLLVGGACLHAAVALASLRQANGRAADGGWPAQPPGLVPRSAEKLPE